MKLYQKLKSLFYHKLYSSINDLPMDNWVEFHATSNPLYLVQEINFKYPSKKTTIKQWESLCSEFYEKFGKTKELISHLERLKKMTVLICENSIKFDTIKKIELDILEQEMAQESKKEVMDFNISNANLSKYMGFHIDTRKTSVSRYYGYIKSMEKQIQLNKKPNGSK